MMPVNDIQIQLIDTPPLSTEYVEPELLNLVRRADLVLVLVDLQSYPLDQLEATVALLEENRIVARHRREQYEPEARLLSVPIIVVVNKVDDASWDEEYIVLCELLQEDWPLLPTSASSGRHLEAFRQAIFDALDVIRVYAKPPNREPDYSAPFVLKRGSTVRDFAARVHKDFLHSLKSARIWGSGVYEGQMVGQDHILEDGDVLELRT
jgi:ribosome-interacting GTPase 1